MNKRLARLLACLLAALLLLSAAACGGDDTPDDPNGAQGNVGDVVIEPLGDGFTQNHAAAAGFGLGADTLDDIRARYGEPSAVNSEEYTALTILTADYPFGQFVFQGRNGAMPVLTYAGIRSQLTAPMGIAFGQSISEAVEVVYTGSAALLGDQLEREVVFYGDTVTAPSGSYRWLTMEYTSATTPEKCVAEYIAAGYDEGSTVKYRVYFDAAGIMVFYELQYITA